MIPYTENGTSNTGDQTVFTDSDTGKSYLVYSYGVGRGTIWLSEIVDMGNGLYGRPWRRIIRFIREQAGRRLHV